MNDPESESPEERFALRMAELAGNDPQLKAMRPHPAVREAFLSEAQTVAAMADVIFDTYADRPALGDRAYEIAVDQHMGKTVRRYLSEFKTLSYAELQAQSKAVALAFRNHPEFKINRDDFVCIVGFGSTEYMILELGCVFSEAVYVPMQSDTSGTDFDEILKSMNTAVLGAGVDDVVFAAKHAVTNSGIQTLVVFDYDRRVQDEIDKFEKARQILRDAKCKTRLVELQDVIKAGKDIPWEPLEPHPEGLDRMHLILHSSGATGVPKGAVARERVWRGQWIPPEDNLPLVTVVFAPLNHGIGRAGVASTLAKGGTAYFTLKPDMSTLFEDIRLARPTFLSFFPRVLETIYQYFQAEVENRLLADDTEDTQIQEAVKLEMRSTFLGDRLRSAHIGGAPISDKVRDFTVECFDIFLIDIYGSTELGLVARNGQIVRPQIIEYKLRDVPELGYYTTDKPFPRGEFCCKSQLSMAEVYKQPEGTAAFYDDEGFTVSGDIVEERGPDQIVVIDRRKDVLKLSQGEYVAVGPLGTLFETRSQLIHQVYVYGHPLRSFLLAVVVPDPDFVATRPTRDAEDAELKARIQEEFHAVAKRENLKSLEVPRDFIIEYEPFSQANGLLSSVRKRLRPEMKRRYGGRLESLYEEIEQQQREDLKALKDPDSDLSVLEKVGKLLEATLGTQGIDVDKARTFAELGGDSLNAVAFAISIEDIFGVDLPADSVLSPTGNPRAWAREIELELEAGSDSRATFASIHGKGATLIDAKDLTLDRFLDNETLDAAKSTQFRAGETRTVLLTGANGFLGHIVCLQWMEKLAAVEGRLICIVRGRDDEEARARLVMAFEGTDPELEARFSALAKNHLEIIAGDVSEPLLGLGTETFDRLGKTVDRICHVGALVNHRLGYEHLFGPNVAGTAEIIRLALTGIKKPIDFVSSQGVVQFMDPSQGNNEEGPICESLTLSEDYGFGYAASKWASEHLLSRACEELGLPVNIIRGNMMLAHQKYKGQINTTDYVTRLLSSIVLTGLAPYSFYELAEDATKQSAHFDGSPVDVVAASVIALADVSHTELRQYNISNLAWDEARSYDLFVDWIESAGYELNRVRDYESWLQRFSEKLKNLPDERRQMSALNVLGLWETPTPTDYLRLSCDNYKSLLPLLSTGSVIPPIDELFIHKCLADLEYLELI